jgi:hypothetical protein
MLELEVEARSFLMFSYKQQSSKNGYLVTNFLLRKFTFYCTKLKVWDVINFK